jgi:hypothetical protein
LPPVEFCRGTRLSQAANSRPLRRPLGSATVDAIPKASPLASAEFATIRQRLIKIGARVIEHIARIRIQLPTSCPDAALFRCLALGLMPSGP